jgi:hypothetical protein
MPRLVDRHALSEDAWGHLQEAVTTGQVVLPGLVDETARVYHLDTRELMQALQWLANQSSNKLRKPIEAADRFLIPKTEV